VGCSGALSIKPSEESRSRSRHAMGFQSSFWPEVPDREDIRFKSEVHQSNHEGRPRRLCRSATETIVQDSRLHSTDSRISRMSLESPMLPASGTRKRPPRDRLPSNGQTGTHRSTSSVSRLPTEHELVAFFTQEPLAVPKHKFVFAGFQE
jgi:hypothetical protein